MPCVMNIWTGDGFKDIPADRMTPRSRYKESIEAILAEPFDRDKVKPCVESKVFGIGVESYTTGSAEFGLSFAATHDGCLPLVDNGHYHPTEMVSDKIPALCIPNEMFKKLQDENRLTELMVRQETVKTMSFGDV